MHPLPDDIIGKSLEVDKMSAEQNRFHWETVLNPLTEKLVDKVRLILLEEKKL